MGGHLIDVLDHNMYSTTIKYISVKILQMIAHKANLEILCGNICNTYFHAYTNKKMYTISGNGLGKAMKGRFLIIVWKLYGLCT